MLWYTLTLQEKKTIEIQWKEISNGKHHFQSFTLYDGLDDNVFVGDLFITFIMIIIITQIFVIVTS